MALNITWEWEFPTLDVAVGKDGQQDVVTGVHWRLTATIMDGEGEDALPVTASTYGSVSVDLDPEAPFINYADIKKRDVRGWVKAGIDVPATRRGLKAELKRQLGEVETVQAAAPWDGGTGGKDARDRKAAKAAVLAVIDAEADEEPAE